MHFPALRFHVEVERATPQEHGRGFLGVMQRCFGTEEVRSFLPSPLAPRIRNGERHLDGISPAAIVGDATGFHFRDPLGFWRVDCSEDLSTEAITAEVARLREQFDHARRNIVIAAERIIAHRYADGSSRVRDPIDGTDVDPEYAFADAPCFEGHLSVHIPTRRRDVAPFTLAQLVTVPAISLAQPSAAFSGGNCLDGRPPIHEAQLLFHASRSEELAALYARMDQCRAALFDLLETGWAGGILSVNFKIRQRVAGIRLLNAAACTIDAQSVADDTMLPASDLSSLEAS